MEETSPHDGIKMTILFAGEDSHVHQTAQPGKLQGSFAAAINLLLPASAVPVPTKCEAGQHQRSLYVVRGK